MDPLNVIVSYDGDSIGQRVGRATLSDDIEEVRRVDQAINRGNEVFRSWALRHGGSIIEIGGDEGRIEVPASALAELPAIRNAYETAVEATVSVGVGRKLSESAKALLAAKLRGKDRVVLFEPGIDAEISQVKEQPEAQKLNQEYLSEPAAPAAELFRKDEPGAGKGRSHAAAPSRQRKDHEEGEVAEAAIGAAPEQETTHACDNHVDRAHKAAAAQEKQDRAAAARKSGDLDQLRAQVAAALQSMQQQLPVMSQLKSAYPDTYKAVMGLVQSVIGLGRELQSADDTLEKAEQPEPLVEQDFAFKTSTGAALFAAAVNARRTEGRYGARMVKGEEPHVVRATAPTTSDMNELAAYALDNGLRDEGGVLAKFQPVIDFPGLGVTRRTDTPFVTTKKQHALREGLIGANTARYVKENGGTPYQVNALRSATDKAMRTAANRRTAIPSSAGAIAGPPGSSAGYVLSADMFPDKPGLKSYTHNNGPNAVQLHEDFHQVMKRVKAKFGDNGHRIAGAIIKKLPPALQSAMYGYTVHHQYNPSHRIFNEEQIALLHDYVNNPQARKSYHMTKRMTPDQAREHDTKMKVAYHTVRNAAAALKPEDIAGMGKGELQETEPETEAPAQPPVLDKASMPPHATAHRSAPLPVGTQHNGEIKVAHADGSSSWKGVRAGMIQGLEADAPGVGQNSHPVSSREPGSR